MADTLTNIQSDARHYSGQSDIVLVSGQGLRIANLIYQGMSTPKYTMLTRKIGRRWPEFSRVDTTLTTTAGTSEYTWPVAAPVFRADQFSIELLDASTSEPDPPLVPVPDLVTWNQFDFQSNSTPRYYRLYNVSGTVKLALRPTPDTTGETIRITGLVEATALTDGSSTTLFLNKNSDVAFSLLIAADFQAKTNNRDRALELIEQAAGLLPKTDDNPLVRGSGQMTVHAM